MRVYLIASLTFLLTLATGCQTKGEHDHAADDHKHAKAEPAKAAAGHDHAAEGHVHAKADATAAKSDCGCGKAESDCAHAAKAEPGKAPCGSEAKTADLDHDDHSAHPIAAGQGAVNPHAALSEKLGQAVAGTEVVDLATLVKDPAAYEGKTVTLQGEVTDMCHHRRGWFAIASPDGKKMVRVITGPGKFLVPQAAMGATAKAEGAVKVVTLDEKQIAYYKRSHKFISDEELRAGGPIKQAILMATGAEFTR